MKEWVTKVVILSSQCKVFTSVHQAMLYLELITTARAEKRTSKSGSDGFKVKVNYDTKTSSTSPQDETSPQDPPNQAVGYSIDTIESQLGSSLVTLNKKATPLKIDAGARCSSAYSAPSTPPPRFLQHKNAIDPL
jgi:hypothetical protein